MTPRHLFAVTAAFLVTLSGATVALTATNPFAGTTTEPTAEPNLQELPAFIETLQEPAYDEQLDEHERTLRIVETASRQQVAQLGLEWTRDVALPQHALPSTATRALSDTLGGEIGDDQEAALAQMDALPPDLRDALTGVINAFHAVDLAAKNAYRDADLALLESLEEQGEAIDGSTLEQAGVKLAEIFTARLALVQASLQLKQALEEEDQEVPPLMVPMGHDPETDPELYNETEIGTICVNCHGDDEDEPNTYEENYTLLIDTSEADKKYRNNAGGHKATTTADVAGFVVEVGASALIDFFGNNEYGVADRDSGMNGGAYIDSGPSSAVGVLLSFSKGDHEFLGGSQGVNGGAFVRGGGLTSPGAAVGFLYSLAGNNTFQANDKGVNGGGYSDGAIQLASGSLLSGSGHDVFKAGDEGVNGGGFVTGAIGTLGNVRPGGFGMLLDLAGDDEYIATGELGVNGGGPSEIQGWGPILGVLVDFDGADRYQDSLIREDDATCVPSSSRCDYETAPTACWNCSIIPKGVFQIGVVGPAPAGAQIDLVRSIDDAPEPEDVVHDLEEFVNLINEVVNQLELIEQSGDDQIGLVGERLMDPLEVKFVDEALEDYEVCFDIVEAPVLESGDIVVSGDDDGDGCAPGPTEAWLTLGEQPGKYVTDAWVRPPAAGVNEARGLLNVTFTSTGVLLDTLRIQDVDNFCKDCDLGSIETAAGDPFELVAVGYDDEGQFIRRVNVTWELQGIGQLVDRPEGEPGGVNVTYKSEVATGDPAIITAHRGSDDQFTASIDVDVVPGDLETIQVRNQSGGKGEPVESFVIPTDDSIELFAAGYDAFGNFRQVDVSWEVDEKLGALDPSEGGASTFIAGSTAGEGTITADHDGVDAVEIGVEVIPASLDRLEIRDKPNGKGDSLTEIGPFTAGNTTLLYAAGYDKNGNYIEDFNTVEGFQWELNPPGLGSFNEANDNITFEKAVKAVDGGSIRAVFQGDVPSDWLEVSRVHPAPPAQLGAALNSPPIAGELFSLEVHVEDAFANLNETAVAAGETTIHLRLEEGSSELAGTLELDSGGSGTTLFEGLEYTTAETVLLAASATLETEEDDLELEGTFEIEVDPNELDYLLIRDGFNGGGDVSTEDDPFVVVATKDVDLVAAGYDTFDNFIEDVPVDWSVQGAFTTNPPPNAAASYGFMSEKTGEAAVHASHGAPNLAVNAHIEVVPGDLDYVRILDAPRGEGEEVQQLDDLTAGTEVALYTAEFDKNDNWIRDGPVKWTVNPDERGFFNHGGDRFTPAKIGEGEITPEHPVAGKLDPIPIHVEHFGPPGEFIFLTEAENYTAGETWEPIEVRVEDGFGNHLENDDETEVRLRLGTGYEGGLDGDVARVATDGNVTFDDIRYTVADEIWIAAEADTSGNGEMDLRNSHGPYRIAPAPLDYILVRDAPDNAGAPVDAIHHPAGEPAALFAAGYDRFDNHRGAVPVQWNTSSLGLGSFDPPEGPATTFTPETVGTGKIQANHTDEDAAAEADLIVTPGPLHHLRVHTAPDGGGDAVESLTIHAGNETELHAAGYDAFGNLVGNADAGWRLDPTRLGGLKPTDDTHNTTFSAAEGGTGRIVVEHDDLQGDLEIPLRVTTDSLPPEAVIEATCTALECTFDATGSVPGTAAIEAYRWDLGDGTTEREATVEHTYLEQGEYEISLNVTDADGQIHESRQTISIVPLPEPQAQLGITTRPVDPKPGDAITATATIESVGSVDLLQFSVRFHVDDTLVREQHYPRLEVGETMNISATWSAREDNQTLRVEVPDHASITRTIEVADPDPSDNFGRFAEEAPAAPLIVLLGVLLAFLASRRRLRHRSEQAPRHPPGSGPT